MLFPLILTLLGAIFGWVHLCVQGRIPVLSPFLFKACCLMEEQDWRLPLVLVHGKQATPRIQYLAFSPVAWTQAEG